MSPSGTPLVARRTSSRTRVIPNSFRWPRPLRRRWLSMPRWPTPRTVSRFSVVSGSPGNTTPICICGGHMPCSPSWASRRYGGARPPH
ncbi:Uncharacterised protein [Mycobacteroides abscessus subsp. abscessus]|nr:Uncharacterised protein [Mycobacteroides abscessus subsp. abscessus]